MVILSQFPVFTLAFLFGLMGAFILVLIRKWVALHLLTSHHEVAFPIFLQLGVIYAVLIAFIFSMVLGAINDAYSEVKVETTNVLSLSHLAPGFPPEVRDQIDQTLLDYTKAVIEDEWPAMTHRKESAKVSHILTSLQLIYLNFNPKNQKETVIYDNSLQHLEQLRQTRRLRIFTAKEPKLTNPLILLSVLGFIVVGISYFFGMHRLWAQMLLNASLIFTITSILTVIYMFSTPFAGRFGIKPYVYKDTLVRLQEIHRDLKTPTNHDDS